MKFLNFKQLFFLAKHVQMGNKLSRCEHGILMLPTHRRFILRSETPELERYVTYLRPKHGISFELEKGNLKSCSILLLLQQKIKACCNIPSRDS